jgi:hypothetical protein
MTTYLNDYHRTLAGLRGGWKPTDYSQKITVQEEDIFIASDVHVPYHDERLLADFLERVDMYGAGAVVWLGDLLDMPTFSSWGQEDLSTHFKRELQIVRGIIRLTSQVVPVQYWSVGNHEERWMRKLNYQVDMDLLADQAGLTDLVEDGRLVISNNPTLLYKPGNWMLTHPGSYGSTPLVVPGKIADKHKRNVVSAHAHHWGQGLSPSGEFRVVESGCLVKPELVHYLQRRPTDHRMWAQGYVGLFGGDVSLFRGGE